MPSASHSRASARGSSTGSIAPDRQPSIPFDRPWYFDPPLPPGESPFQMKGLAHRGLARYVVDRVEGGLNAFLRALPDDAMREFFRQPFLASSFYDMLPLGTGSCVIAEMSRIPIETFAQQQGRAQAIYDVQHAYRALLRGRSSEDFHLRLRPLASRYYNFGEVEVNRTADGRLTILTRGIPSWIMPWLVPMQIGYFAGIVSAMGQQQPLVNASIGRRESHASGIPLAVLELEIVLRD